MRTLAIQTGTALAVLVLAGWFGWPWIKPLGQLVPNTKAMVVVTKEILGETEQLQEGVGQVQANLAKVQRQDQLLARQEELMNSLVGELEQQHALATESTSGLTAALEKQRQSAVLTAEAVRAADASLVTVNANARELDRLYAATERIEANSAAIDGQMDSLLHQLEVSADTFEVIERWREAIRRALQRRWWPW